MIDANSVTFLILLHVESPQQHDRFLSKQSTIDWVRWIHTLVRMDLHNTAATAKAIIQAAKVDGSNPVLTQSGGTHDTWLDRDVKIGVLENTLWMLCHNLGESNKLGMACSL